MWLKVLMFGNRNYTFLWGQLALDMPMSAQGHSTMSRVIVNAAYDEDARVWFIEWSSLPGLRAEADSVEVLRTRLPGLVEDLIELNGVDLYGEIAIEVIARTHATAYAAARAA